MGKDLIYTILELETWNREGICDFCSRFENSENQSVCQIRTRNKVTEKLVANDCACQKCKEKFENDELPKCERCKRLQTKLNRDTVCDCIRYNEDSEEKELPILPSEGRPYAFYEKQINSLQEKLKDTEWTIQEEREAHEDFMEKSEEWGKRQKQELLGEISKLKARVKQLEEENAQNKQVAQVEVKSNKRPFSFFSKKTTGE